MSSLPTSLPVLISVLLGLALLWALVQYRRQRRHVEALQGLSQQVQRVAIGGSLRSRVDSPSDEPDIAAFATAINHLLARAVPANTLPPRLAPGPAPLGVLGEHVHEAVLVHTDTIVYANHQFATLLGVDAEAVVGRRLEDLVPPEYADLVADSLRRRRASEPGAERLEVDLVGLQGQATRLELSTWMIEHEGQPAVLIIGVEVIPTQTLAAAPAPPQRRSRARMALDSIGEALVTTDASGRVDYLNLAAQRILGASVERAAGQSLDEVAQVSEETDRKLLTDPVRQALAGEAAINVGRRALVLAQSGGADRLIEVSASPLRDESEDIVGAVVLLHDVTEIRGLARQMSYQATHDPLTGLVNRREFERRLQEGVELGHTGDAAHVLCYLDLDRFKVINDTGGHVAGDSMLREVAKLLRDAVRDSDTVARVGGDEFAMLLTGCPIDKARQIADDVCRAVADFRFVWKDKIYNIGVSIGLVELARDSGGMEEVMAAADAACYMAKRQGGHVAVYSARDEAFARQSGEVHWLQTLQAALRDNRFELYVQPIVAAFGDGAAGPAMEVLVRLRNDAGQHVPPSEFLRAAERYRLMGLIDRWVVQTTLTALGRGAIALPAPRLIALNISGQTLADAQFLEFVVECFDSTGASPAQVCFEIAENAVIANADQARRFIGVLHGMGCRFALDDFGSGIGSFSTLKSLSVDYLKIDGSFIRNLGRDSVNQAMVSAMIRMARSLNFQVIAEQVEDAGALEAARRMGVDYLQGFALGRPAPLHLAA